MNPKTCSLLLLLLTLLLFLHKSLSINPNYVACKLFECGSLNISYPFYVPTKQPPFCGYQGFDVLCRSTNQTIIRLSGDEYVINSINYTDLSISVTNSAFSSPVFGCLSSVHNLTLGQDRKFNFPSKQKELLLLQNCSSKKITSNRSYTKINTTCKEDDDQTILAVYGEDFHQEEVGKCDETVQVPYEEEHPIEDSIEEVLRKGITLEYSGSNNCSVCHSSGGRCGFNQTTSLFFCACPDRDHSGRCHDYQPKSKYVIYSFGSPICSLSYIWFQLHACPDTNHSGRCHQSNRNKLKPTIYSALSGLVIILILIVCWLRRKYKGLLCMRSRNEFISENRNFETALENYAHLTPKRYTHSEIKKMTNSFKEKLGEGGFGGVYKGKLIDGRLVAVKLLKNSKGHGEGFINEVASIGRTNHVNVVTLLGFCHEGHKRALVYEYMANGSLEKFMHGGTSNGNSLPLETLFQIVLGIARGLEYLHRGCKTRILHFDIKPHNILLDEEFCPKISDFGLAKLTPQDKQSKISMSGTRGTIGYIAPEVFCRTFGDVSHKSDVYSYGMMVLEVIGSRKKANSQAEYSSELYFPQYVYKQLEQGEEAEIDINMNENEKQLKRKMIVVSLWCTQPAPTSRPSMSTVVQMLEGSPESIDIPPIPTFSSPPRLQWDSSTSSITTM